jgi:hypothetical protein
VRDEVAGLCARFEPYPASVLPGVPTVVPAGG